MLAEFEESMRTSRNRKRALIMLASLTEATPRQLAQAIGVGETRLLAIMQGDGVTYSHDRSLLFLGLAEARLTPRGSRIYMITERGRRKARQLTARDARAATAKAALARRDTTPVAGAPLPGRPVDAADPAPVRTDGFAWTVTCTHTRPIG